MGALVKGTKPNINAPDFNRFDNATKSKTLQNIMSEDDDKQKRKADRVARAKDNAIGKTPF